MRVAYTQEEMVGITELSRSLNSFVEKVKSHAIEKLAVMKNNKPEVVVIPTAEYEKMVEAMEYLENLEIEKIVQERTKGDPEMITEGEMNEYFKQRGLDV